MSSSFLRLLRRLARAGVDFVIVGGYAGVVHGCTYTTDESVSVAISPWRICRLCSGACPICIPSTA